MLNEPCKKLGIGTVQFGLDYGISNKAGMTPPDEVREILNYAAEIGISILDTASMYGKSEKILGEIMPDCPPFNIITKTPSFKKDKIIPEDGCVLKDSFYRSLRLLNQERIYGLLIHNIDDLLCTGGDYLFQSLLELKQEGCIDKIGASVYHPCQIEALISNYAIDLIQVPLNVLDQRLVNSGLLHKLKKQSIEIHSRSVFLQGLLLMHPEKLPDYFASVKGHLKQFRIYCAEYGVSILTACIGFPLGISEIDHVIVGVCSKKELSEILSAINQVKPSLSYEKYAIQDETILSPYKWSIK